MWHQAIAVIAKPSCVSSQLHVQSACTAYSNLCPQKASNRRLLRTRQRAVQAVGEVPAVLQVPQVHMHVSTQRSDADIDDAELVSQAQLGSMTCPRVLVHHGRRPLAHTRLSVNSRMLTHTNMFKCAGMPKCQTGRAKSSPSHLVGVASQGLLSLSEARERRHQLVTAGMVPPSGPLDDVAASEDTLDGSQHIAHHDVVHLKAWVTPPPVMADIQHLQTWQVSACAEDFAELKCRASRADGPASLSIVALQWRVCRAHQDVCFSGKCQP